MNTKRSLFFRLPPFAFCALFALACFPLDALAQSRNASPLEMPPARVPLLPSRIIIQPAPLRPSAGPGLTPSNFDPQKFVNDVQNGGALAPLKEKTDLHGGGVPYGHHLEYAPDGTPYYKKDVPGGFLPYPEVDDPATQAARRDSRDLLNGRNEAEKREAAETKRWMEKTLQDFADLQRGVDENDAKTLKKENLRLESWGERAGVIAKQRAEDRLRIDTPVDQLYVDEYPLPIDAQWEKLGSMEQARMPWLDPNAKYLVEGAMIPADAKWEKLGSMERARMPWLDPNANYLIEGNVRQPYDADGFPINPPASVDPKTLKPPRYEELSPAERERLRLLPDSEDQFGLDE
jgi:hypothetical protein